MAAARSAASRTRSRPGAVTIPAPILREIYAHAQAAAPRECCGLLFAPRSVEAGAPPESQAPESQAPESQAPESQAPESQVPRSQVPQSLLIDAALPCDNVQDELHRADPLRYPQDATCAFALSVAALADLDASLEGPHPARVLYHSHVEAEGTCSEADLEGALLGGREPAWPLQHLVVEVRQGQARGARLYDLTQGRPREVARYAADGTQSAVAGHSGREVRRGDPLGLLTHPTRTT